MLIIYAHPNKDGHCGQILKIVEDSFKEKSIDYELVDLYDIGYNPVLKPEEHYTSGHREISPENFKMQEKIKNTDKFIFIYPNWWSGPPAILKGFIDRVFTSRFAFYYENGLPKPLLSGKASVIISMGSPRIISMLLFNDNSVKFLTHYVLKFCGVKAKGFIIDSANKLTEKQKRKTLKNVEKAIRYIM